ncbi:hypothetical protein N0V93_008058 [Gnomoniopsis smithogilvyi]|uniref:Endo-1,4-beta-xylanase n=1 Tax=Gnomoniopsis smithogilvyi TaxID=1191159 RepID=A0A9W9CTI9_9PEZI|nr:hypothetical protein N0V93_008058 [Gnomoniopsis smithogilvyi]
MVAFSSLIAATAAVAGVSAAVRVSKGDSIHKRLTTSSTGTASDGFYYSFWTEESTGVDYEDGSDGQYSVTWESSSIDFVAGKGWATGSDRSITYDADFNPDGNAYLSVYGWTTSPLVEYYICENYGDYDPGSAATHMGTVDADGSTYDIYKTTRTDAASIEGDGETFSQYWSIRQDLRSSGTVTTATHFDAWESLGMTMGSFGSGAYQIVATEGYESSGSSTVTVSEA